MIEFLHRKEELQTKYDLVLNNCKTFANRVFNEYLVGCGQRNTQFFANSDTSNEELLQIHIGIIFYSYLIELFLTSIRTNSLVS